MFISNKELSAIKTKAFLSGRNIGLREGEQKALTKNYTRNDIRRLMDLPIIDSDGNMKIPMSSAEFCEAMKTAAEIADVEGRHEKMDGLMMNLLTDLGYGDAVAIFRKTEMWYA